jgi:DNA polymerase III epsilon subunit-like protein
MVVIDVETTGLSAERGDRVVELGLVRLDENLAVEREWSTLVNPERAMGASSIHRIRGVDVEDAPTFAEIAGDVGEFCSDAVIAGHNAWFDLEFLFSEFERAGLGSRLPSGAPLAVIDTLEMAHELVSGLRDYQLITVCGACGIGEWAHHSALADAKATAELLAHLATRANGDLSGFLDPDATRLKPGWTGRAPSRRAQPRMTLAALVSPSKAKPLPSEKAPPLQGEVAVFTGGLGIAREEASKAAEMLGCRVRTSVTDKTSIVVVGDPDVGRWGDAVGSGVTAKHRDALARAAAGQRIRVMTEGAFLKLASVVSDGVITEDEWNAVREMVYTSGFAALSEDAAKKRTRTPRARPLRLVQADPSSSSSDWNSIRFLREANAESAEQAIAMMQRFVVMLKADLDSFSGTHTIPEWEAFIRTAATTPSVVREFVDRAPGMAQFASRLVEPVAGMAHQVVEQLRGALELVDQGGDSDAERQSALMAAREAEQALNLACSPR